MWKGLVVLWDTLEVDGCRWCDDTGEGEGAVASSLVAQALSLHLFQQVGALGSVVVDGDADGQANDTNQPTNRQVRAAKATLSLPQAQTQGR